MQQKPFELQLKQVRNDCDAHNYTSSLRLARMLKKRLQEESEINHEQLGWAHFYEFRSLYLMGQVDGAYHVIHTEPTIPDVDVENRAWMAASAAELAADMGGAEEFIGFAQQCLDAWISSPDHVSEAITWSANVCKIVAEVDRWDMNGPFACCLVQADPKRVAAVVKGMTHLCHNIDVTAAGELMEVALIGRGLIGYFADDPRHGAEIAELIDRVDSSAWFGQAVEALDPVREMCEAAANGNAARLEELLDGGLAPDSFWPLSSLCTPLIAAASAGQLAIVDSLLGRGADVSLMNAEQRDAFLMAADSGHAQVVARLLEAGADPQCRDMNEQSALHLVGWQGYLDVTRLLLEANADVDAVDVSGNTPLTLAATEDVPDIVSLLLESGANIDTQTPDGQTALIKAAIEGNGALVNVLLVRGADHSIADGSKKSALDYAREQGDKEAIKALEKADKRARGGFLSSIFGKRR